MILAIGSETTYTYNLQGRMDSAAIDADANGTPETLSEYEYNPSGIRVAKTVRLDTDDDGIFDAATRTDYLVDSNNPTGYAQILEELQDGVVQKSYTLGHDVLSQATSPTDIHHLLYDGHGSTRMLVDATGQPISATDGTLQVFAYDAYGLPLGFDPSAALTSLLYSGEQLDPHTALQYLRARYYNPSTGTFTRLDPFFGNLTDPQSLHKYLYTHADPISGVDPTGLMALSMSMAIGAVVGGIIGGVDAFLGGDNILLGVASGVVVGGLVGALVWTFPVFMASSFMAGFGVGSSIPFIVDSFNQGKDPSVPT